MKAALAWLEARTGAGAMAREFLLVNIPGGARWRYVWGGTVLFAIGVQFVTGFFLWLDYSPSAQTAWESVYHIQNQMAGGWLLRGLHHYGAQLLPVLLALHLLQLVVGGAYRSPREVNFWSSLVLIGLVLMTALTGYQLPWDQKGFWATKVAMNLLAVTPVIGPGLQRLLIGGADYGHLTLTRFFAIHAGLLPLAMMIVVALQVYLRRRNGLSGDQSGRRPDGPFWPDQALRNAVVCLAFVATLLALSIWRRAGVELGAPANPSEPYAAARPEWYFLFLYQFLKFFPGRTEIWGAIIIPGVVALAIFLMPFTARMRRGHRLNMALLGALLAAAGLLFALAKSSDANDPEYQTAVATAETSAARVKLLAQTQGIPPEGALVLLERDPLTQGPRLFAQNCATCHRYDGTDALGHAVKEPQSASDLAGFASREWISGLLDPHRVDSTNYFGATKFKTGGMVKFVKKDVAGFSTDEKAELRQAIMAISGEAHLKSQQAADQRDAGAILKGRELVVTDMDCVNCHSFADQTGSVGPDLNGYGSHEWLVKLLTNPAHEDLYGTNNDRMPAFGQKQILSSEQISVLADWLRGDWVQ